MFIDSKILLFLFFLIIVILLFDKFIFNNKLFGFINKSIIEGISGSCEDNSLSGVSSVLPYHESELSKPANCNSNTDEKSCNDNTRCIWRNKNNSSENSYSIVGVKPTIDGRFGQIYIYTVKNGEIANQPQITPMAPKPTGVDSYLNGALTYPFYTGSKLYAFGRCMKNNIHIATLYEWNFNKSNWIFNRFLESNDPNNISMVPKVPIPNAVAYGNGYLGIVFADDEGVGRSRGGKQIVVTNLNEASNYVSALTIPYFVPEGVIGLFFGRDKFYYSQIGKNEHIFEINPNNPQQRPRPVPWRDYLLMLVALIIYAEQIAMTADYRVINNHNNNSELSSIFQDISERNNLLSEQKMIEIGRRCGIPNVNEPINYWNGINSNIFVFYDSQIQHARGITEKQHQNRDQFKCKWNRISNPFSGSLNNLSQRRIAIDASNLILITNSTIDIYDFERNSWISQFETELFQESGITIIGTPMTPQIF